MHQIHGNFFYLLSNKKRLADYLKISVKDLKLLQNDNNYKIRIEEKDGKEREIQEPNEKLKKIHKIIQKSLSSIQNPDFLFSGVKKRSNISNANHHKENDYFITADIKSFYKSCRKEFVYRFFRYTLNTSADIAHILTNITTYQNFLPTGSPSSQIIAYFSYKSLFTRIHSVSIENDLTFSLFVDDITLSSKKKIDNKILKEIIRLMELYELRLKKEKTKFYSKNDFKIVTGVAITPSNKLTYPNKTMNKINRSLEICDKKLHNLSYKEIESTLGRANYLKMIDKGKYAHLSKALTEINKENLRKRKALQNVR